MGASVRALAGMVFGAVLLAGCTGEIMQSRIERPSVDKFFRYAAAPGEMRVVVVGNPFPVSKQVVDQAVVDAMQRNHNGPMTHFTTQPGPDAHTDFRIVTVFNPPANFFPYDLCRNTDAIPSGTDGQRFHLLVGFCVGDKLYSRAKVSARSVSSPADPRFAHIVRTAMWELVPVDDPMDEVDRCLLPGC